MAVAAGGRHRPPAWRRALPENLTGWGFVLPASIIVLGLGFFPVIWSFLLSTKAASGFGPERSVGLANYRELAHDPEWLDAVSRSLKFTLLYVPTTVLLGLGWRCCSTRRSASSASTGHASSCRSWPPRPRPA